MESKKEWESIHNHYVKQDWVNKPSLFAEEIISYISRHESVLELGGGLGQDSIFFARKGYNVVLTDHSQDVLVRAQEKIKQSNLEKLITTEPLDISKPFPYKDNSFGTVYAHLSLHYFDAQTTHNIFSEIQRVLKPQGVIIALFNSVRDPEYGTGQKIEEDYFLMQGVKKRFFSIQSLEKYTDSFDTVLLDAQGETYKDREKGIHNLIRYIGKKK